MQRGSVILYGKPGCHLCDEAAAILRSLQDEERFEWRRVNIESDPALLDRFRYEIPVVQIQRGETLSWPTTRERVRQALIRSRAAR